MATYFSIIIKESFIYLTGESSSAWWVREKYIKKALI